MSLVTVMQMDLREFPKGLTGIVAPMYRITPQARSEQVKRFCTNVSVHDATDHVF